MLTIRSAAKVPPESWPDGGWELDPISSSSLTKLPGPNRVAGRFIVVFGLTLFTWVPLTTKLLNDDPAELKDELKAEACALATARTTSAVTSPPTRLTPADSATPVSVAAFVVESTVLVLEALSRFAFKTLPLAGGTATLRTWLVFPVEAMPGRGPKRLVPVAVNPVMVGTVFTAASQRIP